MVLLLCWNIIVTFIIIIIINDSEPVEQFWYGSREKKKKKKTNNNWGNRTQHSKQNIALGCRQKAKNEHKAIKQGNKRT